MREIDLPITQTFSVTIDVQSLNSAPLVDIGDGRMAVKLDSPITEENQTITNTARRNGGAILYAATSIGQKLDSILLHYFMGPFVEHSENRAMFEAEILQSSSLTFNAKKELVSKVINGENLLPGKKKNALQKYLKKIMIWRNAFAHERVCYDNKAGCFVRYHSGSPQKLLLNNEYWDEVEVAFKECDALLVSTSSALGERD